jgi:glycosyltransferase involved in cell wall biosynthesis
MFCPNALREGGRRMHVVLLTDFAVANGGAGRVAIESARALADAGARVTFVHAIEGADAQLTHPAITRLCLGLTDVWNLGSAKAAANGIWNTRAAKLLEPIVQKLRGAEDTILHVHQWTRAFSPAIFPILVRTQLPLFATVHDYFLVCPNGVFFRFDRAEPCSLTPLSVGCLTTNCDTRSYLHKGVRVLRVAAARHHLRDYALDLVHVSDHGRDRLAPFAPASWRHHRIDNPVSIAREPPAQIAKDAKFAFIGRLTREKGAVLAAAAAAQAKAPILFIGEGPAEADIRALCPEAEITGWLPPDQVSALLRTRVRAVLAPSLWPETGPLTVYEAAAIGLPALASDRCGASERVYADTGFVLEPSHEAFAAAMERLGDIDLARAMGHAAYARYWADPPSPQMHAQRLIALYRSACAAATASLN